jgi:hypothetical protein
MELPTRYTPAEHEADVYQLWEASGGFQPKPADAGGVPNRTFTVMIPPPNVTGVLHMGHALNNTIQDIVIRHRRMNGFSALWVPGTDHAGIATQSVVERMLLEERKQKRTDLGREAFVAEIWKWKEKHGSYILEQFRRLGCSCDWTRTRFTLEPAMSLAVREAFVRLFDKGLVYRGARLVNWDCVLQTAVSDDEIEYVSRKDKLYSIRYPVKGRPGEFVTVATTRPETMLGDTGVAVHPLDERYQALHGAMLVLPLLDREIPLILDESVEREFGTGAVKVTPGHDPADYERGARHRLPIVNLYEKDGRLNENAGPYRGLSREKARTDIVAKLDELLHRDVTGEALDDRVVHAPVAVGTRVAVAADRRVDELRPQREQVLRAEAQALGGPGPPVLHEDVRAAHELLHDLERARLAQVEHERALAAIRVREEGREPPASEGGGAHEVADPGGLHLDHVGALVREHHRREGTRDDRADVDDADSGERSGHGVLQWSGAVYNGGPTPTLASVARRPAPSRDSTRSSAPVASRRSTRAKVAAGLSRASER